MKHIDFFLVQTKREKDNLEKIGIESQHIEICGNLKTEVRLPALSEHDIKKLKTDLFIPEGKRVILAGSTHKGEDEKLIVAFDRARKEDHDVVFIVTPRHPDRAVEIEQLCMDFPFRVVRRSQLKNKKEWDILILDTLGELSRLYSLCDAAFVGGSLIPWGGQNFLEPAFYGKPIFFGPHMDNFQELADTFIREHAARYVHNLDDLLRMFLLSDRHELLEMGSRSRRVLESLQGATDKTLKKIEILLE